MDDPWGLVTCLGVNWGLLSCHQGGDEVDHSSMQHGKLQSCCGVIEGFNKKYVRSLGSLNNI